MMRTLILMIVALMVLQVIWAKKAKSKKKDPKHYTDAEIYALDEQWMEDDDIEEGDLPEHKRPQKPINMDNIKNGDPEAVLKATKKGKTLMMFATVSGNPTQDETDHITALWQSQLANAHLSTERYVISENRILLKINDGAYGFQIKDFLVEQERCEKVTIDGKDYTGRGASFNGAKKNSKTKGKSKKKKNKKNTKSKTEL